MVRNLPIRSKLIGLLVVPVAGTVLLGVAGAAAGWGDRDRARDGTTRTPVPTRPA